MTGRSVPWHYFPMQPEILPETEIARDALQPALCAGPDGTVTLAFLHRGNIVVAQARGAAFGPIEVALDCGGAARGGMQRGPRVGADRTGALTVTAPVTFDPAEQRKRYPTPELYAVRRPKPGRAWSRPTRVNEIAGQAPEGLHALAVAPDGTAHVAWLDRRDRGGDPGQDIFAARLTPDGSGLKVGRGAAVARTVCECCAPGLTLDGAANPTIVWREGGDGESRELFARASSDRGRTFAPARRVNLDPTREAG